MGKSRLSRKRRRALAARDQKPEKDAHKFILPPKEDNREAQKPVAGRATSQQYAEAGIVKRKRRERRADKVKDRIKDILSDPDVSKVTIVWGSGGEKTFNFVPGGGNDTADGEKLLEQRDATELLNGEQRQACSACGMPPQSEPTYGAELQTESELPAARMMTPNLPAEPMTTGFSPMASVLTEARNSTTDPRKTVVLDSPSPIQEAQIKDHTSPQITPRRTRRNSLREVANSQASEDSFHESQEYLRSNDREETGDAIHMTQTTPVLRRIRSDSPVLGLSPVLEQISGDGLDEEESKDISPPAPVQSSPQLPALLSMTEPPAPGNKRARDPYELAPTPPQKRVLRSSGKAFATPPWKSSPIPRPGSDTYAVKPPARGGSGLLRGKSVVSEAELLAVFSDPDPEFDRLDGRAQGVNIGLPARDSAAARKETPVLPPEIMDKRRKENIDMPPPTRDESGGWNTPMPPRGRAIRQWKEDNGELSDETSYTGVMSTPLRNYGATPRTTSSRRSGPRLSTQKPITPKGGAGMGARGPNSGCRRSAPTRLAARMAELPTSSTADSVAGSPRSYISTKATTPMDEAAPKPVVAPKAAATPKSRPKPQGGSMLPKIPSLTKKRQGGSMLPKIPSLTKRRSSKSSGPSSSAGATPSRSSPAASIRGSLAGESSPVNNVAERVQTPMAPPSKSKRPRVEVLIPALENQAAYISQSSQPEPQAGGKDKPKSQAAATVEKRETLEETGKVAPRRRSLRSGRG